MPRFSIRVGWTCAIIVCLIFCNVGMVNSGDTDNEGELWNTCEGVLEQGPDFRVKCAEVAHLFPVEPLHEAGTGYAQFNVETVVPPEEAPIPRSSPDFGSRFKNVESTSESIPSNLERISSNGHGFSDACIQAFEQHRPLILKPDDLWVVIANGLATHVNLHAEELRHLFVEHAGNKALHVQTEDDWRMGKEPAERWENDIFPQFSKQIRVHVGNLTHDTLVGPFSTSTVRDIATFEITLMGTVKNYFSYSMGTVLCGIPWIRLEGDLEDWVALRQKVQRLEAFMVPAFAKRWLDCLLPVLDEFISAYTGRVNHLFWQSMVKIREEFGSGDTTYISGWIGLFFPYLKEQEENANMRPWNELTGPHSGILASTLPEILSDAPVFWEYHKKPYTLRFYAGSFGVDYDVLNGGALRPRSGWLIAFEDPESHMRPSEKVLKFQQQRHEIIKAYPNGLDKAAKFQLQAFDNQAWDNLAKVFYGIDDYCSLTNGNLEVDDHDMEEWVVEVWPQLSSKFRTQWEACIKYFPDCFKNMHAETLASEQWLEFVKHVKGWTKLARDLCMNISQQEIQSQYEL